MKTKQLIALGAICFGGLGYLDLPSLGKASQPTPCSPQQGISTLTILDPVHGPTLGTISRSGNIVTIFDGRSMSTGTSNERGDMIIHKLGPGVE